MALAWHGIGMAWPGLEFKEFEHLGRPQSTKPFKKPMETVEFEHLGRPQSTNNLKALEFEHLGRPQGTKSFKNFGI